MLAIAEPVDASAVVARTSEDVRAMLASGAARLTLEDSSEPSEYWQYCTRLEVFLDFPWANGKLLSSSMCDVAFKSHVMSYPGHSTMTVPVPPAPGEWLYYYRRGQGTARLSDLDETDPVIVRSARAILAECARCGLSTEDKVICKYLVNARKTNVYFACRNNESFRQPQPVTGIVKAIFENNKHFGWPYAMVSLMAVACGIDLAEAMDSLGFPYAFDRLEYRSAAVSVMEEALAKKEPGQHPAAGKC
jgi:hypothetical protein